MTSLTVRRELLSGQLITVAVLVMNFTSLFMIQLVIITGFDVDTNGNRQNAVLETFANMSKNPIAKTAQGSSNYYPDVFYRQSEYIYWMDHTSNGSNWGTDTTSAYTVVNAPVVDSLQVEQMTTQ